MKPSVCVIVHTKCTYVLACPVSTQLHRTPQRSDYRQDCNNNTYRMEIYGDKEEIGSEKDMKGIDKERRERRKEGRGGKDKLPHCLRKAVKKTVIEKVIYR